MEVDGLAVRSGWYWWLKSDGGVELEDWRVAWMDLRVEVGWYWWLKSDGGVEAWSLREGLKEGTFRTAPKESVLHAKPPKLFTSMATHHRQ